MPRTAVDLTNQRFGMIVAVKFKDGKWKVKCDCGKHSYVLTGNLTSGKQKSCGCKKNKGHTVHGQSGRNITPEYRCWKNMMTRCYNPNFHRYADWGGRGIQVCKRWHKFENFFADMGKRPEGPPRYSLERKNNDKNYSKSNCIWATYKVQNNNTRRNVR